MLLQVIDDPSVCNTWDMWGLSCAGGCTLGELDPDSVRSNPPITYKIKLYKTAHVLPRRLLPLQRLPNVKLSHNEKTRICFSEWFGLPSADNPFGTCTEATQWCEANCYGHCKRVSSDVTRPVYEVNAISMRDYATHPRMVNLIADAMVETCMHFKTGENERGEGANLRWHGVGDLNPYSNRVAAAIVTRHPEFTLWGFTRRYRELNALMDMVGGPRANLVFWCSVDRTTDRRKVHEMCEVARRCGTGLAYCTEAGEAHGNRKDVAPRVVAPLIRVQPAKGLIEDDKSKRMEIWKIARQHGTRVHVAFGYHGGGRTTHLGLTEECPSTDPLAGGHFYASCQWCQWCWRKRHGARNLKEHRVLKTYVETEGDEAGQTFNLDQPEPL